MFPEGTKPVAGRWRATTGLQVSTRMHPGSACRPLANPLARPHGGHPFQIGSRWWRFSATHRLPSVFPSGNRMHPSRVQIPRVFPARNDTNGTMFRSGKAKVLLPEGTPPPFPSENRGPPMFPEGTKPVAGRWRATTGLQVKKRMHPSRACKRRSIPLARPHGVHPFQIGARWWRFSATHRLPSVFPYGNRMHPSRAQIPEYSPRRTTRTNHGSHPGTKPAQIPEGTLRPRSLHKNTGRPCSRRKQNRQPLDDFQSHCPDCGV